MPQTGKGDLGWLFFRLHRLGEAKSIRFGVYLLQLGDLLADSLQFFFLYPGIKATQYRFRLFPQIT